MRDLRFAILGTGYWARYQLAGWQELPGVRCVALYNRTRSKAEALASEFGITTVEDNAERLLDEQRLDFVDIITSPETHARFVGLAARRRLAVICQKPMGTSLAEAARMVASCRKARVPFFVHENWRWQRPLRELDKVLRSKVIGRVFRARFDYLSSFPVFENQPFLKNLEQFILTDIGSHILDTARFLFGEAKRVVCQTHQVHPDIRGEDVATVVLQTVQQATVTCNLSYASRVEHDRFPETLVFVEGDRGSVELAADYWLRVTTAEGTHARRVPPVPRPWADPRYLLVQSSIVDCNANLLRGLRGGGAETTGADNLQTLKLVYSAYESAARCQTVRVR